MDDKSRVMIAAVIGAVAGATWGYLYLTAPGRRIRAQIEPRLDDFVGEMRRVQGTIEKARVAADEGWRSLNDITGSRGGGRWSQDVSH